MGKLSFFRNIEKKNKQILETNIKMKKKLKYLHEK